MSPVVTISYRAFSVHTMNYPEYTRSRTWLQEGLKDALSRGDYHLECDVIEKLQQLDQAYYEDTDED